jgi:hypothetical protein
MELLTANGMCRISLTFFKFEANFLTSNIGSFLGAFQNQNNFEKAYGVSALLLGSAVKKNPIEFQKYLNEVISLFQKLLCFVIDSKENQEDWNLIAISMILNSAFHSSKHLAFILHGKNTNFSSICYLYFLFIAFTN